MDQIVTAIGFDPAGTGPAYRRLALSIADAIRRGALLAGAPLPTERGLARDLGLSRVTVRAAYRALAQDGLLRSRPGSGTYVRAGDPPFEQPLWRLSSFSNDMAGRGRVPRSRILDLTRGEADAEERAALALSPGARVVRLRRIRLVDAEPVAVEAASLPEEIAGTVSLGEGSLYAALAAHGLVPTRGEQRLRAVTLEPDMAALLSARPGLAAMLIERIAFLPDGRPIEFTRSHTRGDAYAFVARLDAGDLT